MAIACMRRLFGMRDDVLKLLYVFLICLYQEVVHAQEAAAVDRPIINPLALGGMVQGLLDMQIRPQGGFYEERYKALFPDEINIPTPSDDLDRRHTGTNSMRVSGMLSQDGKLLKDSSSGKSANPCFDQERIARNRLLLLMCSLQLSKTQSAISDET